MSEDFQSVPQWLRDAVDDSSDAARGASLSVTARTADEHIQPMSHAKERGMVTKTGSVGPTHVYRGRKPERRAKHQIVKPSLMRALLQKPDLKLPGKSAAVTRTQAQVPAPTPVLASVNLLAAVAGIQPVPSAVAPSKTQINSAWQIVEQFGVPRGSSIQTIHAIFRQESARLKLSNDPANLEQLKVLRGAVITLIKSLSVKQGMQSGQKLAESPLNTNVKSVDNTRRLVTTSKLMNIPSVSSGHVLPAPSIPVVNQRPVSPRKETSRPTVMMRRELR